MPIESSSTHRGPVPGGAAVPPRSEPDPAAAPARPVLLVESSPAARGFLHRVLTVDGFAVLACGRRAAGRAGGGPIGVRPRGGEHAGGRRRRPRARGDAAPDRPRQRIVVVTDVDSFATVVLALRAGADDFVREAGRRGRADRRAARASLAAAARAGDAAGAGPHLLGACDAPLRAVRPQRDPRPRSGWACTDARCSGS